jgi:hypothetical protein
MSDLLLKEGARVVAQDGEHLFEKNVIVRMPMAGPWPVFTADGKRIGAAVADLVEGGIKLRFILDKNTPEAFDLEVNPTAVKVRVNLLTVEGVVEGSVTIDGI